MLSKLVPAPWAASVIKVDDCPADGTLLLREPVRRRFRLEQFELSARRTGIDVDLHSARKGEGQVRKEQVGALELVASDKSHSRAAAQAAELSLIRHARPPADQRSVYIPLSRWKAPDRSRP